ncbi:MAG: helix-turn-helix domain-containing protein [Defluviitaleaceae bacterium]|nr:helix-turn-helix domain-containing protein [Defluviitaleaceae bacterium]
MPVCNSAAWVRELRKRKKWSIARLQFELKNDFNLNIFRIERGTQQPKVVTMQTLGVMMSIPMNDFICPILVGQPANVYTLRYHLSQALQAENIETARELYGELTRLPGFETPINRQFLLSQKAQLDYLLGEPPEPLLKLIREGISQTLHKYDAADINNALLVYEEPILFHTMAKVYLREGDTVTAIRILEGMRESFNKLPINDVERDATLAPILLTLTDALMLDKEYEQAVSICDEGLEVSATRNHGAYTPAFLHNKATCMRRLNQGDSARTFYRLAFFGYELLHKRNKALRVLEEARRYDLTFDTYGVEDLEYTPVTGHVYNRSDMEPCDNIFQLIKNTREKSGLTQEDVYQGICSKSTLSKIENGRMEANHYILEPIFQRLGLDINLYCRFYLGTKNFEIYRERERMHQLLIQKKYDEAEAFLIKLENLNEFRRGTNLQFIIMAKATFHRAHHGLTPNYLRILHDALAITWPDYNEDDISTRRLTHYETILINQIAGYYYLNEKYNDAEKIYNRLMCGFNNQYKDETEKIKLYATMIFNYASCLHELKQYQKSMEILDNGINFDIERERLYQLPQLILVWAYNLFDDNKQKESAPYFVLAYYVLCIFADYGKSTYKILISNHMKEHFNITFE